MKTKTTYHFNRKEFTAPIDLALVGAYFGQVAKMVNAPEKKSRVIASDGSRQCRFKSCPDHKVGERKAPINNLRVGVYFKQHKHENHATILRHI